MDLRRTTRPGYRRRGISHRAGTRRTASCSGHTAGQVEGRLEHEGAENPRHGVPLLWSMARGMRGSGAADRGGGGSPANPAHIVAGIPCPRRHRVPLKDLHLQRHPLGPLVFAPPPEHRAATASCNAPAGMRRKEAPACPVVRSWAAAGGVRPPSKHPSSQNGAGHTAC